MASANGHADVVSVLIAAGAVCFCKRRCLIWLHSCSPTPGSPPPTPQMHLVPLHAGCVPTKRGGKHTSALGMSQRTSAGERLMNSGHMSMHARRNDKPHCRIESPRCLLASSSLAGRQTPHGGGRGRFSAEQVLPSADAAAFCCALMPQLSSAAVLLRQWAFTGMNGRRSTRRWRHDQMTWRC